VPALDPPAFDFRTVYLGCAVVGGLVLVLQTALLLFGHSDAEAGAHDGDGTHDHGDAGLTLVSVRTISAFLAFFGLAGWGALRAGWSPLGSLGAALGAGTLMLFAVAWLFSLHKRLAASGNLEPARAVGLVATVYLRIPAANASKGKIQVVLQGRTAEFLAFTTGARELASGSQVRIVRQVTPDTFEVEPLS
jgi:hypothetical protein